MVTRSRKSKQERNQERRERGEQQRKKNTTNLPIIAARTKRLSRLQTIIFTPRGVGRIL